MKMLISLAILVFVFTSCTSVLYQEEQREGKEAIENYEDTRLKYDPEKMTSEIKAQLIGKWQLIGIEIENETVNAQATNPKSESGEAAPSSDTTAQTPTALESPQPDTEERTSEQEPVQLPPITIQEHKDNQKIAAAKMALVAANRKNLTLEFYEERTSYYYRGSNRGRKVTGQCKIIAPRVGDVPLPFIRFRRRTGPKMLEFLFTSEPARLMTARSKQAFAENTQRLEGKNYVNTSRPIWGDEHENVRRLGGRGSEKAAPKGVSYMPISALGIEVTSDRLCIILEGDMELTPNGWTRTGGLRCVFKRIE